MNNLIIGIKGHVVCLNKQTGDRLWHTKLKTTSGITNVSVDDEFVYAYSSGHLYCLSTESGEIQWHNPLTGMGYGPCIIATQTQDQSSASAYALNQQTAYGA